MNKANQNQQDNFKWYHAVWHMAFWEAICDTKNRIFIAGTWVSVVVSFYCIVTFVLGRIHGQTTDTLLVELAPVYFTGLLFGARGLWGMLHVVFEENKP